jgi:hypothetical protein
MLHAAYGGIVRRLPITLKAPLKRAALSIIGRQTIPQPPGAAVRKVTATASPADATDLKDFVRPETMNEILSHLHNPP